MKSFTACCSWCRKAPSTRWAPARGPSATASVIPPTRSRYPKKHLPFCPLTVLLHPISRFPKKLGSAGTTLPVYRFLQIPIPKICRLLGVCALSHECTGCCRIGHLAFWLSRDENSYKARKIHLRPELYLAFKVVLCCQIVFFFVQLHKSAICSTDRVIGRSGSETLMFWAQFRGHRQKYPTLAFELSKFD